MDYALIAIAGLAVVVLAAAFSKRLGIAAPLLLVVIGVGYSFLAQAVPGLPEVRVAPEIILTGVLPPLLYSAAITVPLVDFRRNLRSITVLSVLLVVGSAVLTGFILFAILPKIDLGSAIALGAVISPTDVVAATSISKRLGLPPRLLAILEGEGLVNDATALVILKTAVGASALSVAGEFSAGGAIGSFIYAVVVAILIGVVIGVVAVFVRRKLDDPILDTAISFIVPFLAYLPAERLGASGVIAVVAAGLYSGHSGPRYLTPQSRIAERLNWRTVQFVLENGVFLLMGVQIAGIISAPGKDELSTPSAVLLGLLMVAVLISLRYLVIVPLIAVVRRREAQAEKRRPELETMLERVRRVVPGSSGQRRRMKRFELAAARRSNDLDQLKAEGLSWRGGAVLGWAGMRGVVTLAAAQSLDEDTPYYPQLVLIAFTVAVATLLLQGSTLPLVIRLVKIRGRDRVADRRELATLLDEMAQAGLQALESSDLRLPSGERVDPEVVNRVRSDTLLASEAAWERADRGEDDDLSASPHGQVRALRGEVLQAERATLLDARSRGAYASRILLRAQSLLDLEEARLQQMESGGRLE